MPDPEMVSRAHRAAAGLEQAWERWRVSHGLAAEPMPPVSSYVGYSIEEPWGRPRVVFGMDAHEAEVLAALLDSHEQAGFGAGQRPAAEGPAGPAGPAAPAGPGSGPAVSSAVPAESSGVPAASKGVPAENNGVPAENNGVPAASNGVPADDSVIRDDAVVPHHRVVTEGQAVADEGAPAGAGTAVVPDQSSGQAQTRPEDSERGQSPSAERAPVAHSRARSGRRPFTPRPVPDHTSRPVSGHAPPLVPDPHAGRRPAVPPSAPTAPANRPLPAGERPPQPEERPAGDQAGSAAQPASPAGGLTGLADQASLTGSADAAHEAAGGQVADQAGDPHAGSRQRPGQDLRDADGEGPSGPAAGRKEGSDTIVAELAGWAAGELPGQASARLAAWAAVGGVPPQGYRESGAANTGSSH